MKLKRIAKIHNRYDISVMDAETNEVKLKAVGYNVITDKFMQFCSTNAVHITRDTVSHDQSHPNQKYIVIGDGNGTPTISDTALFNQIGEKNSSVIESVFQYPTSHYSFQIKLEANEYVGKSIKEVGFRIKRSTYYDRQEGFLASHAMLQDSEGNPITIQKTDTDVVYITFTLYVTLTQTGFGDEGVFPSGAMALVKYICDDSFSTTLNAGRFPVEHSDSVKLALSKSLPFLSGSGSTETQTFNLPTVTILDSEWNNHVIKTLGIPGIGAFHFPDPSVFPDYDVSHLVVGEGDGVTREFNIKCPLIKPDSVRVYIDGDEITTGFTADCESNCGDWYENYHTAALTCDSDSVEFGDMKTRSPGTNNRYDPLGMWKAQGTTRGLSSCTVSQAHPIWLDFGEAKECNRLKIDGVTVPSAQINNLVIEYSEDNANWTRAVAAMTNQVWSFALSSARYWRVYIPGYNWSYSIINSRTLEDVVTGASFFLGKTVPGLVLDSAPLAGQSVDVSYKLEVPFKTANNLLRFDCSIQFQRG